MTKTCVTERPCDNFDCKHNIFWKELFRGGNGQKNHWKVQPSRLSESIKNCMLNLDEPAKLEDIAETYGIAIQTVAKIVNRAMKRVGSQLTGKDFFD